LELRAQGLSYRQIARQMGIGEGTVRSEVMTSISFYTRRDHEWKILSGVITLLLVSRLAYECGLQI